MYLDFRMLKKIILNNKIVYCIILKLYASLNRVKASIDKDYIYIKKQTNIIKLSKNKKAYAFEIIKNFNDFINTVLGEEKDNYCVYNFSSINSHKLREENVYFTFSGFPEDLTTNKIYEKYLNIQKGDVIVDLGANCGYTAYRFSKLVGDSGKVICVEPDSINYECLIKNINNLKLTNIISLNKAIWNKNTKLNFQQEGALGSAVSEKLNRNDNIKEVETIKISDLIETCKLEKINILKIDIEGAEYELFTDLDEIIEKYSPKIIMEMHYKSKNEEKIDYEYFYSFFDKHNYRYEIVEETKNARFPLIYAETIAKEN